MREVLGDVVGDVVVLAVEVEGDADLEGVDDGEAGTGVAAGGGVEGVERGEAAAGVVEEELADEGVEGGAEEEAVDLVLDVVELAADVGQLLRVDLAGEGDLVGQLAGLRVEGLDGDALSFHGGEVAHLAQELLREEEEAGEVDDQPDHREGADGVHDLPAQDGLLRVLPLLHLGHAHQQVLRVHVEVFPRHLHGVLHLLRVVLQHPRLAVGDVHQVGQLLLGLVVGLDAVGDHEEVEQQDDGHRGVQQHVLEEGDLADAAVDDIEDGLLVGRYHVVQLVHARHLDVLYYREVAGVHHLCHVGQDHVHQF